MQSRALSTSSAAVIRPASPLRFLGCPYRSRRAWPALAAAAAAVEEVEVVVEAEEVLVVVVVVVRGSVQ